MAQSQELSFVFYVIFFNFHWLSNKATLLLIILARDFDFSPPLSGLPKMSLANEKKIFHDSKSFLAVTLEITVVNNVHTCILLACGILFRIASFLEKSILIDSIFCKHTFMK